MLSLTTSAIRVAPSSRTKHRAYSSSWMYLAGGGVTVGFVLDWLNESQQALVIAYIEYSCPVWSLKFLERLLPCMARVTRFRLSY